MSTRKPASLNQLVGYAVARYVSGIDTTKLDQSQATREALSIARKLAKEKGVRLDADLRESVESKVDSQYRFWSQHET